MVKNDCLISKHKFSFKKGLQKPPNPKFWVKIYFMLKNHNFFLRGSPNIQLHDTYHKKVFKNDCLTSKRKFSFKKGLRKTPNPKFWVEILFMSKDLNIFLEAVPICNFMARTREKCSKMTNSPTQIFL